MIQLSHEGMNSIPNYFALCTLHFSKFSSTYIRAENQYKRIFDLPLLGLALHATRPPQPIHLRQGTLCRMHPPLTLVMAAAAAAVASDFCFLLSACITMDSAHFPIILRILHKPSAIAASRDVQRRAGYSMIGQATHPGFLCNVSPQVRTAPSRLSGFLPSQARCA